MRFAKTTFLVLAAYVAVNLLFMHNFWQEVFFDRSLQGKVYGEVVAVEWSAEQLYQNIKAGQNPFSARDGMLYPFGTTLISTDSGNGFFFPFLRPFLSVHQSYSVIVSLSFLMANIGMYVLLRKLKVHTLLAFIIGLAYGYMTFLQPRMGHLTYVSIYVFPWFYVFLLALIQYKRRSTKILSSVGLAFVFALTLYLNLYYFVILAVSVALLLLYGLVSERSALIRQVRGTIGYLGLSALSAFVFLAPWLFVLYDTYRFEGLPKADGWAGAINFSADLTNFFIPSQYSYFLGFISQKLGLKYLYLANVFEGFAYPGVIILGSFVMFGAFLVKGRVPVSVKRKLLPFLFVSVFFFILALGPFLHVFGKWGFPVEENIRIVVPLPFAAFHYLPFMENIRAPGRLIVGGIFFGYIVAAYMLQFIIRSTSRIFQTAFYIVLVLIVVIDHFFLVPVAPERILAKKAYEAIAHDPQYFSFMEVPSAVRDGFIYFGDNYSLDFIDGQLVHKKPILAGYFGRVPRYKIEYYQNNPFLGYVGRISDENLEVNGGLLEHERALPETVDLQANIDAIDFLGLKYILLDSEKLYSASMSAVLSRLGFKKLLQDGQTDLLQRPLEDREFLRIDVLNPTADTFLGNGWLREEHKNLVQQRASVLFKVMRPRPFILKFQGSAFYRPQTVAVYVNKQKVGTIAMDAEKREYVLPIDKGFKKGINTVYFLFPKSYRHSDVVAGSTDRKKYAASFSRIYLEEVSL